MALDVSLYDFILAKSGLTKEYLRKHLSEITTDMRKGEILFLWQCQILDSNLGN